MERKERAEGGTGAPATRPRLYIGEGDTQTFKTQLDGMGRAMNHSLTNRRLHALIRTTRYNRIATKRQDTRNKGVKTNQQSIVRGLSKDMTLEDGSTTESALSRPVFAKDQSD